ncbi:RluA family pseudouridine synthase [Tuberibacillus sp. Marseille-P3662]|uniref:RluA family pseudouridine synthase n=1 Tax=Tuberibacillus sp. Marseille-P3662 TaxID=1965358 RepID=UPI000A1CDFF6|nr:RluA family pseudouridine synthase [Tuberibacillus sp. Marseille-P3662]
MSQIELAVDENASGQRIDKFLQEQLEDQSRTHIQDLIKNGQVQVNQHPVKSNYKIQSRDSIEMKLPDQEAPTIEPETIPLDIIDEDEDVLVVNKPRGMVVHPAPGHTKGTLVNALLAYCHELSGINGMMRPGIVHRIDKETSGLLVVAKNDKAHAALAEQIKAKSVYRAYQAIVHGVLERDQAAINAPIGRHPKNRKKMAVTPKNSKAAVTHFTVLERYSHFTFVQCRLETGRTHQIRVHMDYIGHPVAGDPKYGPRKTLAIDGQALHASELGFIHPGTKAFVQYQAPLPEDMYQAIGQARENTY